MAEPRIKYATTQDGVRIAYWTMGSGPRLLVTPPLLFSHLAREWQFPAVSAWYERMARSRTVIRWDPRGYGMSERETAGPFVGGTLDIEAVLDRVPGDGCDVIAISHQGNGAIEYAAGHPQNVTRLVIFQPLPSGEAFTRGRGKVMIDLAAQDETLWSESIARAVLGWESGRQAHAFAEFLLAAVSRSGVARFAEEMQRYDAMAFLSAVRAPALIINTPMGDTADPLYGRSVASAVPDAELVELEGGSRFRGVFINEPANTAIADFLGLKPDPHGEASTAHGTAIILFTDIADSTTLTESMGDAAFRDHARALDDALRTIITGNGGTPIDGKLLGDGVLATFPAASQAIEAARACSAACDGTPLKLHLGIHAGDVIRESDNVFGGAVNIAARICALSAPGEILVSATVRDLARTSAAVQFEDRGPHDLKGIADPVHLFAVR